MLHTLLEFFSIMVSFFICTQGWLTFRYNRSSQRLLLAAVFMAVGFFDLLHTLTYQGMPQPFDVAVPTWFWLAARLTECVSLLLVLSRSDRLWNREMPRRVFALAVLYIAAVSAVIMVWPDRLPLLIKQGQGLTPLKISLEYAIGLFHLATVAIVFRQYQSSKQSGWLTVVLASTFIFLGELQFAFYQNVHDLDNLLGHVFKVLGYLFMMNGVYARTIQEPYRQRESAEKAMKEANMSYFSLLENSHVAIVILQQKQVVYANPAYSELTGLVAGEWQGRQFADTLNERERPFLVKALAELEKSGAPGICCQIDLPHKNGGIRTVEMYGSQTLHKGEPAILCTLLDISERMEIEREKQQKEEMLRKYDKLTVAGHLAAGFAHEVRNPLTVLRGFVQLMRVKGAIQPSHLDLMLSEITRIDGLLAEFLVFAKPQTIEYKGKDVRELLEAVLALTQSRALMNSIELSLDFKREVPPVCCDENQMKQVFINLVNNAIEAMPGGGEIRLEVSMVGSRRVSIRVVDQGIGMSREQIDRIGEPFFTTKPNGSGLGLMVTHRIVESHKGRIYVESEPGKGSAFEVVLPVERETGIAPERQSGQRERTATVS